MSYCAGLQPTDVCLWTQCQQLTRTKSRSMLSWIYNLFFYFLLKFIHSSYTFFFAIYLTIGENTLKENSVTTQTYIFLRVYPYCICLMAWNMQIAFTITRQKYSLEGAETLGIKSYSFPTLNTCWFILNIKLQKSDQCPFASIQKLLWMVVL